jgi:TRAP-type C4-dicarboxylate transport system permease small subunit
VRGVSWLSAAFGVVSAALLVLAMLVVCQMILWRYAFRLPTIWQTDFAVYAATAAIFLGAPYVLLTRGHVGVDVVETLVRAPGRRRLRLAGSLLGLAFCLAMLVASVDYVHEAWAEGWQTSGLWQIPLALPTLPLPVAFGLLSLQYLAELLRPEPGSAP